MLTAQEAIFCFTALSLKHCIIDFPLQTPYQYLNKGTFLHPGGIIHAALHGCGTLLCLLLFVPSSIAALAGLADAAIHYTIDWTKVNLNKRWGLTPQTEQFWWLLGTDQLAHYLMYSGLLFLISGITK